MTSKLFKQTLFLTMAIVLALIGGAVFATETPAASDNAVTLYANYGNGFEFLAKLYFEKNVTEQSLIIEKPITEIRIVRGKCYDLNIDRLTLNGICPTGFERKLSKTDNDLIEIVDSADFKLSGTGELVIAARAPKDIMGEQYSIKFPKHNIGTFKPTSFYYNYTLGSNYGVISDDNELKIPSNDKFFVREMCYPDSGHPNAPIDFYVADDGETLYVFFEAFVDNTLDNGKDFAGVHIKCGDIVKSYKVYTTEENEYGRWWFDYTNSSSEYNWQHMSYLVKIPVSDIQSENGTLDLAFEYYGTVSAQEELEEICVGDVLYISEARKQSDENYAQTYNHDPYYDETVRVLPAPGKTSNAESGDTQEGEWWITNTGTKEKPEYTLTLNGATINKTNAKYNGSNYFWTYGSVTIELKEGTTNTIGVDSSSCMSFSMDITGALDVTIQGDGTLYVYGKDAAIYAYTWTTLTICDGATVNAITSGSSNSTRSTAVLFESYYKNNININNATLTVINNNSSETVVGIVCGGNVILENNATLEITTYDGTNNYALYLKGIDNLKYDSDSATIIEGNSVDDAEEVDELTNTRLLVKSTSNSEFYSMPYVCITQGETTPTETIEFEVVNIPTGGENTATIGNNVEVSYDSDKYMVIPDQYAEDLESSENYKWFEGVYESGSNYTGSALVIPTGDMVLHKAGIEIKNASLRKVERVYDGNDEPTGELKLHFDVLVQKDATVIKSLNAKCKTLPKSGDTYFEPEVSNGNNFEVFSAHWEDASGEIPSVFEKDKDYYLILTVTPKRGYIFGDTVSATVNSTEKQEVQTEMTLGRTELKLKVPKKVKTSSGGGSSTSDYKVTTKIENGTITPDIKSVKKNATQEFKFKADKGYEIVDVIIDGKSVGAVDSYTLEKVTDKHTIEVKTRKIEKENVANRFVDVKPSDWFYDHVNCVVENGWLEGTTETTFSPNQVLTRGMFTVILYRLAGATDNAKPTFSDVDKDKYYASAIAWANKNGYVIGIGNNKFNPEAPITREDLATIIYRYLKTQGKGFVGSWMFLLDFVDREDISEYAYEPICYLTMHGILEGKEGNRIDPKGFASRAETAKMVQKVAELLK